MIITGVSKTTASELREMAGVGWDVPEHKV